MAIRPAQVYPSADVEGRGEWSLSMAEGTPSREVLFLLYPPTPFSSLKSVHSPAGDAIFKAYEYGRCVTSLPGLLSNRARGKRLCGAKGKSVALAQTVGRKMLKVLAFLRKGIMIKLVTQVLTQSGSTRHRTMRGRTNRQSSSC